MSDPNPDVNPPENEPAPPETGAIDIKKLLDDPAVLEALLNHDKVKETIKKATEAAIVKPEEPKPEPKKDNDMEFIKKKILTDAISKLSQSTLLKFTLDNEGKSLVEKMDWIDKNVKVTPDPPAQPPTGLPGGTSKVVSYWDPAYKHQYIDNRKK